MDRHDVVRLKRAVEDPGRISDKLASAVANEANALYDEWASKVAGYRKVSEQQKQAATDEQKAAEAVRKAIRTEVDRGGDLTKLSEAEQAHKAAVVKLDPDTWQELLREATEAAGDARDAYTEFLAQHWKALVKDHEKQADAVQHELDKLREQISPVESEHNELARSQTLILSAAGITKGVAFDYSRRPYADAILADHDRWEKARAAERERVAKGGYESIVGASVNKQPVAT